MMRADRRGIQESGWHVGGDLVRCAAAGRSRSVPALLLVVFLLASGCTGRDDEADVRPTHSAPPDTIAATRVGARLTVTASVVRLLAARAFVVRDVDLPPDGLLVLGDRPSGLRTRDLVMARGTIQVFAFDRFGTTYQLADSAPFAPYAGRKVLVADLVRSWARPVPDRT